MSPLIENFALTSRGGLVIEGYATAKPSDDAPTLLIVHGYAEHMGRYAHVMQWAAQRGWHACGVDLRGHGRSEGHRAHVDRFEEYLDDVGALLDWHEARGGATPWVLGHSMGGLVAVHLGLNAPRRVAGVVLSSPALGFALPVPAPKRALAHLLSRVWPTFSLPTGIPPAVLTHDEAIVHAYEVDPLVARKATARWYTEMLRAQAVAFEAAPRFSLPLLALQAGDDRLVDARATRRFVDSVGSEDTRYVEFPGMYHEILNEVERDRVFAELGAWLDAHASPGAASPGASRSPAPSSRA